MSSPPIPSFVKPAGAAVRLAERRAGRHRETRLVHGVIAAAATTLGAVVFSFPPLEFVLFPAGALALSLLPPYRLLRALVRTPYIGALCAQLTAVFIYPFDWIDRFGFFTAMLGAVTFLWIAITNDSVD